MNQEQFQQEILPHKNRIYRFALRLVGDMEQAKDITQEVLIKVWKLGEKMKEIRNVESFCITLTKNLAFDKMRVKANKWSSLDQIGFTPPDDQNPYNIVANEDMIMMLRGLIGTLPPKQKMVMQLRDVEGFSYEEIVDQLDMPLGQVKINLFRARQFIKSKILKAASYGI